jgi:hypothetical protein
MLSSIKSQRCNLDRAVLSQPAKKTSEAAQVKGNNAQRFFVRVLDENGEEHEAGAPDDRCLRSPPSPSTRFPQTPDVYYGHGTVMQAL